MRGRRNRRRPRAPSGRLVAVFGFDQVHALTVGRLVGGDGQPESFLEGAGKRATHGVGLQISLTVAPSGWRSIAITWACLLFSRVRGALAPCFRSASTAVSAAWTAGASACGGVSPNVL